MGLSLGSAGLALIKQFEGYYGNAYLCPAQVWTIGWGTTVYPSGIKVKKGDSCTQAQATEYLNNDCRKFVSHVNKYYDKYKWNQNQFDALVSFAYNIGNIDQLTANGTRDNAKIASSMLLYTKAGNVELTGLVRRRKAENELFKKAWTGGNTNNGAANTSNSGSSGSSGSADIKYAQQYINNHYKTGIATDGIMGSKTKAALVKALQTELNIQTGAKLTIDGIFGTKTYNACITVKKGAKGKLTAMIQAMLLCYGYSIGNGGIDGYYQTDTYNAVKRAQSNKNIAVDGICGKNTFKAYLT